jgi:hypothetical protein
MVQTKNRTFFYFRHPINNQGRKRALPKLPTHLFNQENGRRRRVLYAFCNTIITCIIIASSCTQCFGVVIVRDDCVVKAADESKIRNERMKRSGVSIGTGTETKASWQKHHALHVDAELPLERAQSSLQHDRITPCDKKSRMCGRQLQAPKHRPLHLPSTDPSSTHAFAQNATSL